jgi:hypothetical protein
MQMQFRVNEVGSDAGDDLAGQFNSLQTERGTLYNPTSSSLLALHSPGTHTSIGTH